MFLKITGNSQETPESDSRLDKSGGKEYELDKRSDWGSKTAPVSALPRYELYSKGS